MNTTEILIILAVILNGVKNLLKSAIAYPIRFFALLRMTNRDNSLPVLFTIILAFLKGKEKRIFFQSAGNCTQIAPALSCSLASPNFAPAKLVNRPFSAKIPVYFLFRILVFLDSNVARFFQKYP